MAIVAARDGLQPMANRQGNHGAVSINVTLSAYHGQRTEEIPRVLFQVASGSVQVGLARGFLVDPDKPSGFPFLSVHGEPIAIRLCEKFYSGDTIGRRSICP